MRHLTVIHPGLLTTVQDLGRWGWQNRGVAVAGPMDPWAHRRANALLGNDPRVATLEVTLRGPELIFEEPACIAVCGALFPLTLDGRALTMDGVSDVPGGGVVRFGDRTRGARAYLAVDGGIDVPVVLGSRATHLASAIGGIGGRAVRARDRLAIGEPRRRGSSVPAFVSTELPNGGARVRIVPGPQLSLASTDTRDLLARARYRLDAASNRMGYRLSGPALAVDLGAPLLSSATVPGALQVPPGGHPILLMADRQTTGGYPVVACVIAADIGLAGQLVPGDWIELAWCDPREALDALMARERELRHATDHD